ncbi:MAG: 50S ribosomal protein L11 methyltransferase, partial [Firmicutes bacterium]|nr:50S ribosomal protein L11 methyltransferase [Bacillota bacterium]
MLFKEISISTTSEFSEIVAYVLTELGSQGTAIHDAKEIKKTLEETYWDYVDDGVVIDDIEVVVKGFFDEKFDIALVRDELNIYSKMSQFATGSLKIEEKKINSKDWERAHLKYFKPKLIGNLTIVPTWDKEEWEKKGEGLNKTLYIDPGLAFGTGIHETTSMCIEHVQNIEMKNKKVVDVGCGSGILGLCSLRLEADNCLFLDMDENAIIATNQNAKTNYLSNYKSKINSLLDGVEEKFDVVLANLTADLLLKLANYVTHTMRNNGRIIVSGIIDDRVKEVKTAYLKHFTLEKEKEENGWFSAIFKK